MAPAASSAASPQAAFAPEFDVDGNGSPESLISYPKQGKQFSFFAKDELASQIVAIKKKYTDYHSFANADFHTIFPMVDENRDHKIVEEIQSVILVNNKGNGFSIRPLPFDVQSTMIFDLMPVDLNHDGFMDLLCGGNLYEVMPSIGRLDAGYGNVLMNDRSSNLKSIPPAESGFFVQGAVRKILPLKMGNRQAVVVIRNNQSPVLFEVK